MEGTQKITVHVPEKLLAKARQVTGAGLTSTIRKGLELLSASTHYHVVQGFRGRYKPSIALERLRADRK